MTHWTRDQKHIVVAGFLGWVLDAFDFFLLVFLLERIAEVFHVTVGYVAWAITLTLAMRPFGAILLGSVADRFGRKPAMILNVAAYSVLSLMSGLSPNITVLLILRALFGIVMGGEWGISAAFIIESVPTEARGFVSGLLQAGYPIGYLLASVAYGVFYDMIGWRGVLMLGFLPALLTVYIRYRLPESAVWKSLHVKTAPNYKELIQKQWKLIFYCIFLMTAFNFLSHGSQDLYPTFLEIQNGFHVHTVSMIAIIYNIGAIIGGVSFGMLSERLGRRRTITLAILLTLPVIPFWAFSHTAFGFAVGAFFMQMAIQGAWGVIPAYLNELAPHEARATFSGFVYQMGNFLASSNATLQIVIANYYGGNYAYAMTFVVTLAVLSIAFIIWTFGFERRGVAM